MTLILLGSGGVGKSEMEERKSWASAEEAKQAHGFFECLAHNLALLFKLEIYGSPRFCQTCSLEGSSIRSSGNSAEVILL